MVLLTYFKTQRSYNLRRFGELTTRMGDSIYQRVPQDRVAQALGLTAEALLFLRHDTPIIASRSVKALPDAARLVPKASLGLSQTILDRFGLVRGPEPDPKTPHGQLELVEREVPPMHHILTSPTKGPKKAYEFFMDAWHPKAQEVEDIDREFTLVSQMLKGKNITSQSIKTPAQFAYDYALMLGNRGIPSRAVDRDILPILADVSTEPITPEELIDNTSIAKS